MIYFTSSWDDGAIYDIKLADLLLKHNQKATFFLPIANVENRKVINEQQIHDLSQSFEIGAHTLNHRYLTTISDSEAEYEIKESKKRLESITDKPVHGFCFPGGKFSDIHLRFVREAGFSYVRTTNMFKMSQRNFLMNTTLQAYNHKKTTYLYHLLKRFYVSEILKFTVMISFSSGWDQLLSRIIRNIVDSDSSDKISIIHLWGHSYDLENYGLWSQLERVLDLANKSGIQSKTNFQVAGK